MGFGIGDARAASIFLLLMEYRYLDHMHKRSIVHLQVVSLINSQSNESS